MTLRTDPEREATPDTVGPRCTGIYVRAQRSSGEWSSVDIAELDRESLLEWLRQLVSDFSGVTNLGPLEALILMMLGHGR